MYYIYRITNLVDGKTYIGQHKYKKLNDSYRGSGKLLWRAYRKYGFENFTKEILYSNIQYKETADDMERFTIAKERAIGKAEYNIADGGNGGDLGEEVNKRHSEIMKGDQRNKGRHHTEEARKHMSDGHKGKHLSEEHKKNISEALKGKQTSKETRRKLSEANKGNTNAKGCIRSEGWRRKHSEVFKGSHWFNNGIKNVRAKICPEGFVPGYLKIK